MSNKDLTVIFLTVNKLPEKWVAYHKKVLLEAVGDYPIITVSSKLMPDMPGENIIQDKPICASNVYFQMLRAAKLAKTPYIAIAEDDSLYPYKHFHSFRPPMDKFAYNMNRWAVLTWGKPTFFWKSRLSNLVLIAPREYAIEALEERFKKYPNGMPEDCCGELGRYGIERKLKLTQRGATSFETKIPVINLNHIYSIDPYEQKKVKKMWPTQCFDLPHWGSAENVVSKFI